MPNKKHWKAIEKTLEDAVSIAFDTCHKIYVLQDEGQHQQMESYGYDPLIRIESIGVESALLQLKDWYAQSCGLRFINAVRTVDGNPNDGFTNLIAQFE